MSKSGGRAGGYFPKRAARDREFVSAGPEKEQVRIDGTGLLDAPSRRIPIPSQPSFVLSSESIPDRGFAEDCDGERARRAGAGLVFGSRVLHVAPRKTIPQPPERCPQSRRDARFE